MGYYINHRSVGLAPAQGKDSAPDLARCRAALENGSVRERREALRQLIAARAEGILTQCLASADPAIVQLAVAGLWECWLDEAGTAARREMETGVDAMNEGDLESASKVFSHLMDLYPEWAEAINKLATVLYLQGEPQASIGLCRQVIALKPDHFGAWNGLVICAVQTEDWALAHRAVCESLRIQPHSPTNRQLLHLVESRLAQL